MNVRKFDKDGRKINFDKSKNMEKMVINNDSIEGVERARGRKRRIIETKEMEDVYLKQLLVAKFQKAK